MLAKLTEDERKALASHQAYRDKLAIRLGAATVEYERTKENILRCVSQSVREEKRVAAELAVRHGVDPEKVNFTITPDGELIEVQ